MVAEKVSVVFLKMRNGFSLARCAYAGLPGTLFIITLSGALPGGVVQVI